MYRPWGNRSLLRGAMVHLTLVGICTGYALGAAFGWGSPRFAKVMGDFGLSAAALLAACSCLWYARTRAGEFRAAWTLFGLSSLMVSLGNAIWGWYEVVLRQPVPYTSAADFCFLLFAPLAIVGLLMLAKRPVTLADWACRGLDAWLIGGSLFTLSWSVALTHAAQWQGETVARAALALAYPLLDIALVSMVLVLHFRRSAAQRSAVNTAIGALALTVLCDALFTSPMLREQYSSGQLLDAGWFAGSLLLAYAPWVPSRLRGQQAAEPPAVVATTPANGEGDAGGLSRPLAGSLTALAPYLAAGVCTVSILMTTVNGQQVDREVLLIACAVVLALVIRQGIMLLDNIALTRELAQQENHFRSLVQGSSDVIMIAAPDGLLRYVSPAAAGVYGQRADALIGSALSTLIHPEDMGRVLHELRRFLAASPAREPATRIECRVRHGAGYWLNVESSVNRHEGGLIFNSRDVTERVRLQTQLQHNASHDALTDLPNRALFIERVRLAVGGRRAGDGEAAVFYIDLDGFKAVNDSVGHQAGDELLVQAAQRLREAVRAGDTTARLGGDEFAALILGDPSEDDRPREVRAMEIAERVRMELARPYTIDGAEVRVAASVGIAFAEPGTTPTALLRNADLAMYRAKQAGKARVEFFVPRPESPAGAQPMFAPPARPQPPQAKQPSRSTATRRTDVAARLCGVPRPAELTLLHQPVVELVDGRVTALSVQPRWCSVQGPHLAPADLLEHDGLPDPGGVPVGTSGADGSAVGSAVGRATEAGRWLLEEALTQAALRHRAGQSIPVAVRLPAALLSEESMGPGGVEALLVRHGLPPEALVIELPEAGGCLGSDELRRRLTELRRLGVGIAVDGFGGAGNTIAVLRRLPVDLVRLDRELVDGLLDSPRIGKIIAGLVRMTADLGIASLAGGVDRPEQVALLRAMGCTRGQGRAFCEPLEGPRLMPVLERGRCPVPADDTGALSGGRSALLTRHVNGGTAASEPRAGYR